MLMEIVSHFIKKSIFLITHPKILLLSFVTHTPRLWSDKFYLQVLFRYYMGQTLNLKDPKSFSEKLQWLKLYNRKPEYTVMVDKIKAKDYVASIIGKEHIIPTIGVWDDPEKIDFDALPDRFVLKCNHNSGTGMYICKDKLKMDIKSVISGLRLGLKEDYFFRYREWPYKNVPRRILAEKYMEDESGELRDYKFFCFDGEVKALFIATDRSRGRNATRFDFFDENFNHLPFTNGHPNARVTLTKPRRFEEMKLLASKLSKGIAHVRIDFYEICDQVYFGEITFFHWAGLMPFKPKEWDYLFGQWIKLPE